MALSTIIIPTPRFTHFMPNKTDRREAVVAARPWTLGEGCWIGCARRWRSPVYRTPAASGLLLLCSKPSLVTNHSPPCALGKLVQTSVVLATFDSKQGRSACGEANFRELRLCEVHHSPGPDVPRSPARKQEERAARLKVKGVRRRGPPKRCDTHNPTTADRGPPLPGDHNQLYQVAISQSLLSPGPRGPKP